MNAIIIGFGEVGRAHFEVLRKTYNGTIFYKDKGQEIYDGEGQVVKEPPTEFELMLVATQCDPTNMGPFYDMVFDYYRIYKPKIIDILTTTPCGTAELLEEMYVNCAVCKSTIRGMHGSIKGLASFLLDIPKHIGGPSADILKDYYEAAGIPCRVHAKARAPELFHALNNSDYGVAIMKAQENYDICRNNAVSYMEYLEYKKTNNEGFLKAGYPDKLSPILTPPGNGIFGHCVVYSATTIPQSIRGPLMDMLAHYNDKHNAPVKSDKN